MGNKVYGGKEDAEFGIDPTGVTVERAPALPPCVDRFGGVGKELLLGSAEYRAQLRAKDYESGSNPVVKIDPDFYEPQFDGVVSEDVRFDDRGESGLEIVSHEEGIHGGRRW